MPQCLLWPPAILEQPQDDFWSQLCVRMCHQTVISKTVRKLLMGAAVAEMCSMENYELFLFV